MKFIKNCARSMGIDLNLKITNLYTNNSEPTPKSPSYKVSYPVYRTSFYLILFKGSPISKVSQHFPLKNW